MTSSAAVRSELAHRLESAAGARQHYMNAFVTISSSSKHARVDLSSEVLAEQRTAVATIDAQLVAPGKPASGEFTARRCRASWVSDARHRILGDVK